MSKPVKIEQHSGLGMIWFIGWLFSIGFLKLGFSKGLLALFLWPYLLGVHFAELPVENPAAQLESQQE